MEQPIEHDLDKLLHTEEQILEELRADNPSVYALKKLYFARSVQLNQLIESNEADDVPEKHTAAYRRIKNKFRQAEANSEAMTGYLDRYHAHLQEELETIRMNKKAQKSYNRPSDRNTSFFLGQGIEG